MLFRSADASDSADDLLTESGTASATVTDLAGNTAQKTFHLNVVDVNRPPVLGADTLTRAVGDRVVKVPARSASAPKLGSLPAAGFGIQRALVKKCHQSSRGTIGAASLKMNTKMAAIPTILLQPQARIATSIDTDPLDRRGDRLMARVGLLDDAAPLFAEAESVAE